MEFGGFSAIRLIFSIKKERSICSRWITHHVRIAQRAEHPGSSPDQEDAIESLLLFV